MRNGAGRVDAAVILPALKLTRRGLGNARPRGLNSGKILAFDTKSL